MGSVLKPALWAYTDAVWFPAVSQRWRQLKDAALPSIEGCFVRVLWLLFRDIFPSSLPPRRLSASFSGFDTFLSCAGDRPAPFPWDARCCHPSDDWVFCSVGTVQTVKRSPEPFLYLCMGLFMGSWLGRPFLCLT
ncbi:hypothetical protein, unlikely [Trypanosoma brucei gambiense DAL972]|uniref:Uncharacterized protein n=1 Tax=Trypanosoma brucei gambiense (strain MHOM/CI/86/DAL972) TaxID=679716 RepID=C9ZZY0_TRYB9|nr:hypothetical protein, unlikely [Trypanosoma brucei gambiense DAL972]CBH16538.1 hypothetical protein, unlikely [Trypanosoma brucei gambiense DAL972]|eukprot:XP_011778802.1 hypothetical protein, unlikely [Trypanosoma brucei gambiense DAL972]